jgi:serine protease
VLRLPPGRGIASELRLLRTRHDVQWAVPDFLAHAAGALVPNDPGAGHAAKDWQQLQWNFVGPFGVDAPGAWANLAADGAPGGRSVIVAVLDTGVAYARRGPFRRSPDLSRFQFVRGYDFVGKGPFPNDRNGHGTFVASTIAEDTNNRYGLTGLAYGARIMPVRVLDSGGEGEASTIAEGVFFAVRHGAQVINLSLEFSPGVTASDIPELIEALRYAHRRGVLVVGAAGNEGHSAIAYPARAPYVIAVGATTEHGCLAAYSNDGSGLSLVAPGGGPDAGLPGDPNCHPDQPPGRDIYQVTFTGSSPRRFGIPSGYEGTSMATPHVTAIAALIIASGVLGHHPSPAALTARLRATARKLGGGGDERLYGAGLVDAAAATSRGGPGAVAG